MAAEIVWQIKGEEFTRSGKLRNTEFPCWQSSTAQSKPSGGFHWTCTIDLCPPVPLTSISVCTAAPDPCPHATSLCYNVDPHPLYYPPYCLSPL